MKSKITIDLDEDNQPVIKVDFQTSEDVRDKMIARFFEKLGYGSVWFRMKVFPHDTLGTKYIIRPISSEELEKEGNEILGLVPKAFTCSSGTGNIIEQPYIKIY